MSDRAEVRSWLQAGSSPVLFVVVSAFAGVGEASAIRTYLRVRPTLQDSIDVLFLTTFPLFYLLPWITGVVLLIRVKRASSAGDVSPATAGLLYHSVVLMMLAAYVAMQNVDVMDRLILHR